MDFFYPGENVPYINSALDTSFINLRPLQPPSDPGVVVMESRCNPPGPAQYTTYPSLWPVAPVAPPPLYQQTQPEQLELPAQYQQLQAATYDQLTMDYSGQTYVLTPLANYVPLPKLPTHLEYAVNVDYVDATCNYVPDNFATAAKYQPNAAAGGGVPFNYNYNNNGFAWPRDEQAWQALSDNLSFSHMMSAERTEKTKNGRRRYVRKNPMLTQVTVKKLKNLIEAHEKQGPPAKRGRPSSNAVGSYKRLMDNALNMQAVSAPGCESPSLVKEKSLSSLKSLHSAEHEQQSSSVIAKKPAESTRRSPRNRHYDFESLRIGSFHVPENVGRNKLRFLYAQRQIVYDFECIYTFPGENLPPATLLIAIIVPLFSIVGVDCQNKTIVFQVNQPPKIASGFNRQSLPPEIANKPHLLSQSIDVTDGQLSAPLHFVTLPRSQGSLIEKHMTAFNPVFAMLKINADQSCLLPSYETPTLAQLGRRLNRRRGVAAGDDVRDSDGDEQPGASTHRDDSLASPTPPRPYRRRAGHVRQKTYPNKPLFDHLIESVGVGCRRPPVAYDTPQPPEDSGAPKNCENPACPTRPDFSTPKEAATLHDEEEAMSAVKGLFGEPSIDL